MRAACEEVGRDPATFDLTIGTFIQLPENGQPIAADTAISVTYAAIAATLQSFAAAGVRHLNSTFRPDVGMQTLETFGHVLELMHNREGT